MPGNFDNIIREVMNSTQAQPVDDVVPFPQDKTRPSIDQYLTPREFMMGKDPYEIQGTPKGTWFRLNLPKPANEASIAQAILRG